MTATSASASFLESAVVVTGAATGIGHAVAGAFARAGATTWLLDIDREGGSSAAAELTDGGLDARFVFCDVTDADSVGSVIDHIGGSSGLDVLVNNAGGFWEQSGIEETSDEDWHQVLALNLTSVFICCRAAAPFLRAATAGRIVNIGSLAGQTAIYRSSPAYAAAKAGVHALTRVLAYELAADGVTANAVAPSAVLTDRILEVRDEEERAATAASIPLGRYAVPDDVVGAVLFLSSAAAGFVTGQTLAVNGGRFMA